MGRSTRLRYLLRGNEYKRREIINRIRWNKQQCMIANNNVENRVGLRAWSNRLYDNK